MSSPASCQMTAFHSRVAGVALLACATAAGSLGAGADREMLTLDGDVSPVHDPVVIKEKNSYYVCCTGGRNVTRATRRNLPRRDPE